jgi:hypothetical protein
VSAAAKVKILCNIGVYLDPDAPCSRRYFSNS